MTKIFFFTRSKIFILFNFFWLDFSSKTKLTGILKLMFSLHFFCFTQDPGLKKSGSGIRDICTSWIRITGFNTLSIKYKLAVTQLVTIAWYLENIFYILRSVRKHCESLNIREKYWCRYIVFLLVVFDTNT